jgi:lysozyme
MWKALKVPDYQTAAIEMLDSRWAKQTPNRAGEMSSEMAGLG